MAHKFDLFSTNAQICQYLGFQPHINVLFWFTRQFSLYFFIFDAALCRNFTDPAVVK